MSARADAERLAEELRDIIESFTLDEVEAGAISDALELAQSLRNRLRGPRRPRWYELDAETPTEGVAREAYRDQSPMRGALNPLAPPLRLEVANRPDGKPGMSGRAKLRRIYEGPPHGVHGGLVAALFDELLGAVLGLAPPLGVTARLEVTYRNITPIEEELAFEGWIEEDRGRRILAHATCHCGDTLTAEAKGLFLRVDFDEVQQRMWTRRENKGPVEPGDGSIP